MTPSVVMGVATVVVALICVGVVVVVANHGNLVVVVTMVVVLICVVVVVVVVDHGNSVLVVTVVVVLTV